MKKYVESNNTGRCSVEPMWRYVIYYDGEEFDNSDYRFVSYRDALLRGEAAVDALVDTWNLEGAPYDRHLIDVDADCYDRRAKEDTASNGNVPVEASAVMQSVRIENMYDVKTALEDLIDSLSMIEDNYFDIEETDPKYPLRRYLYDISRHLQSAYNKACKFVERDN